jgi:hypothetical protein
MLSGQGFHADRVQDLVEFRLNGLPNTPGPSFAGHPIWGPLRPALYASIGPSVVASARNRERVALSQQVFVFEPAFGG